MSVSVFCSSLNILSINPVSSEDLLVHLVLSLEIPVQNTFSLYRRLSVFFCLFGAIWWPEYVTSFRLDFFCMESTLTFTFSVFKSLKDKTLRSAHVSSLTGSFWLFIFSVSVHCSFSVFFSHWLAELHTLPSLCFTTFVPMSQCPHFLLSSPCQSREPSGFLSVCEEHILA
jgi:hypothetical protein